MNLALSSLRGECLKTMLSADRYFYFKLYFLLSPLKYITYRNYPLEVVKYKTLKNKVKSLKGLLLSSASCTPRKRKDLEPTHEPSSPDKPTHAKPSTIKPEPVRPKSKPTSIKPNPAKSKEVLNSKSEKKLVTLKKEPGAKEQVRGWN